MLGVMTHLRLAGRAFRCHALAWQSSVAFAVDLMGGIRVRFCCGLGGLEFSLPLLGYEGCNVVVTRSGVRLLF
ncbi:hypothetical protein JB92DRAFT_2863179, partial [Gautieria morchelliformis]